jgi:hypothetical protein
VRPVVGWREGPSDRGSDSHRAREGLGEPRPSSLRTRLGWVPMQVVTWLILDSRARWQAQPPKDQWGRGSTSGWYTPVSGCAACLIAPHSVPDVPLHPQYSAHPTVHHSTQHTLMHPQCPACPTIPPNVPSNYTASPPQHIPSCPTATHHTPEHPTVPHTPPRSPRYPAHSPFLVRP